MLRVHQHLKYNLIMFVLIRQEKNSTADSLEKNLGPIENDSLQTAGITKLKWPG